MPPVHQAKFSKQLRTGQKFTLKCKVNDDAKKISISLNEHDSNGQCKNIILRIDVRFEDKVIVRNTNIMGHWGPEEKDGPFPLEAGKNFVCVIVVHEECYKILFNDKMFCEYKHRAPVDIVTNLCVEGDVTMQQEDNHQENSHRETVVSHLETSRQILSLLNWPSHGYNIPIPYRRSLNFHEGAWIFIKCRTPSSYERFTINLVEDEDNKPFHFDVRHNYRHEKVVVRNTYTYGLWGKEEREGGLPFEPNHDYDIIILSCDDCFKVAINGKHFVEYKYRTKTVRAVKKLNIHGDLILRFVLVC